jgi:antitoxin ParD1/3/4
MPEQMTDWVYAQISTGRYGNVSEYFRELVRKDQETKETAIKELQQLIQDGVNSGFEEYDFEKLINAAREEARQKGLLRA